MRFFVGPLTQPIIEHGFGFEESHVLVLQTLAFNDHAIKERELKFHPMSCVGGLIVLVAWSVSICFAQPDLGPQDRPSSPSKIGSPYVPVESWVYPAFDRLIARGYIKSAFQGLRPWTRMTCARLLSEGEDALNTEVEDALDTNAPTDMMAVFSELEQEFSLEMKELAGTKVREIGFESVYTRPMGISSTPVNDSAHLGQTVINDYGRPYGSGFNNVTGFTLRGQVERFALYADGEYQHAPASPSYSSSTLQILANVDGTPAPLGDTASGRSTTNDFRLLDTYISGNALGVDISVGKQSLWWGPSAGGAFAISDNATPFWMFRINRTDPFRIPGLSRVTGPFRLDAFFGELADHRYPPHSFIHAQKVSFKPTANLEVGFSRIVVFAGANHVPLTFGSFFNSFFSVNDVSSATKFSRNDPGARHSAFDFSYRLPGLRNWLTLYTDSIVHDDVSPISAPHRSAINPGLYLSHVPGIPKLDFRVEAVSTDPSSSTGLGGQFIYWEVVYKDVYLNKGNIFGDWIGKEGKGYQAWTTYWLSPKSSVQLAYREAKVSPKFIPGGTTQNDISAKADLWLRPELDIQGFVQYERWLIPVLSANRQSDVTAAVQLTFRPKDMIGFRETR